MSNLTIFKNDEIFSGPIRLLVKESHAIFSSIPRNSQEMTKPTVISISRRYRSVVHECVENLLRDITSDHADQIRTFKELEVIWNLCEILLLDVSQTGALIVQLKNWIKMHFDDLDSNSKEILRSLDDQQYRLSQNDVDEYYWNLLIKLVLRGETKKAVNLLSCHYEYERNDQMQLVASMLENMPLSNQYIVHEFCNKWTTWSNWCQRERETGQFESNQNLSTIVRLLSQDLTVYDELTHRCESWYHLMVAYLLYNDPCIKETDLSGLCRRMIATFKANRIESTDSLNQDGFNEIIVAAFEYDLVQVLALCCSYLDDNWWFVTHFVDLLYCSNQLKVHDIIEPDRLRESFLLDYASTLFDNDHLWQVGVSYLENCPESGLFHLDALLSRIPLSINDEVKAHTIISLAEKRGLKALSKSVSVLMSRLWLSKTPRLNEDVLKENKTIETKIPPAVNLSNALYWAIKSGNTPLITQISDQYLYYYCKRKSFPDRSVFECLRRSTLNNERLAFLAKYYEFKQLLSGPENDLSEAGNLLRSLMASKIYPSFFCQELLNDANSLLESRTQIVLQPDKTLDISHSIEQIQSNASISDELELRKNLTRNIARALITPVNLQS